MQKYYTEDFLTKKPDPMAEYEAKYLRDDHEGIVSRDIWDKAQMRLRETEKARSAGLNCRNTAHPLYGRLFCASCGEPYRRCTASRVSGNYKTWRCRGRVKSSGCKNRHVEESVLFQEIADALEADIGTIQCGSIPGDIRIIVEDTGVRIVQPAQKESA